jgi:hypothetical protein
MDRRLVRQVGARNSARIHHDRRSAQHRLAPALRRLHDKGFIKTGATHNGRPGARRAARPAAAHARVELAGVFAVADVRANSMKRVASGW